MKDTKKIWWIWLMLIAALAACQKTEYMPEPEGGKIPYAPSDSTLQQLLAKPEFSLLNKAWQKSNMESFIAGWGKNTLFTLLAPDDAAMRAAGLDDAGIGNASQETLDSLLMFHTLIGAVDESALQHTPVSIGLRTLLVNPIYKEALNGPGSAVTYDSAYRYLQYIAVRNDGQLLISGRSSGSMLKMAAKNGAILKISRVLKPATKNLRQTLEGDPRFSLYVEALKIAEDTYSTVEGLDEYSFAPYFYYSTLLNTSRAETDYDCWCPRPVFGFVERTSLFAPTNDAFIQAGLRTVEDLRALNARFKPVYENYNLTGYVPLDSLLHMNNWGRQRSIFAGYVAPVFFNNDLVQSVIKDYHLKPPSTYAPPVAMPLEFSKDANGRVQLQWIGSSAGKATVIESDIETLQGPIHVIDRLLVPPGFHF